jgi:hypothetical protein
MQAYAWFEILRGYYVARKNDDRAGGGQTNISAVNHAQSCRRRVRGRAVLARIWTRDKIQQWVVIVFLGACEKA